LLAAALAAVAVPLLARAQTARQLRIGLLNESTEASRHALWEQFRKRLAEHGYVEGRNLVVDARYADNVNERLPALASELVALKPDVLVAVSTPAARAAKQATTTIPVVFIGPADPVGAGLVSNLARPEANVTGVSPMQADIGGKWIELAREIAPHARKVGYLTDVGNSGELQVFEQVKARGMALGIDVRLLDGVQPGAIDRALEAARDGADALVVGLTAALLPHRDRIVQFAAQRRLPAVYARRDFVDAGGLVSYGTEPGTLFRRTADYVHRIAQGAKPAQLPVEQPTVFQLVVNRRAAREQQIAIPQSLLVRADDVLQ
jgi:putative ABC transport system substrate-binding protein